MGATLSTAAIFSAAIFSGEQSEENFSLWENRQSFSIRRKSARVRIKKERPP
jgi:hypothetical protein